MEYSTIELDRAIIHNADEPVMKFIAEWQNQEQYIIAHTSGSTGQPKSIRLMKQDMLKSAIATCKKLGIGNSPRMVMPLSADYIAGKMMIVRAMVSGGELWVERPSNDPIHQDYGSIDLIPIVPSQINALLHSQFLHNIRNVLIGGGAITAYCEEKLISSGINAYATYGMTETCSHVALRHIGTDFYEALPGITFDIDNRNCLVINATQFTFDTITTNDIVDLCDHTKFKWVGRHDNVINTGGIKVFPEDIERKLQYLIDLPFYIAGTPDAKWGEAVTLYIESEQYDTSTLHEKIKSKLDNRYHIPKRIICVEKFQRTQSGKIKRIKY